MRSLRCCRPEVIASQRAHATIFLLVTACILYGSLYPFAFYARPGSAFAYLLSMRLDWDHPGDLLATSMELLQFYDRGRVTSIGDVYADSLGATVGGRDGGVCGTWHAMAVHAGFASRSHGGPGAADVVRRSAVSLCASIPMCQYPYVPVSLCASHGAAQICARAGTRDPRSPPRRTDGGVVRLRLDEHRRDPGSPLRARPMGGDVSGGGNRRIPRPHRDHRPSGAARRPARHRQCLAAVDPSPTAQPPTPHDRDHGFPRHDRHCTA